MCGIVGYVGKQPCIEVLFSGLKRLEYRGYDSAGIAVSAGDRIEHVKAEGKLEQLRPLLSELPGDATRGIGHTRWATHGVPNRDNAHPHVTDKVALVHNGIVENHTEIKQELEAEGVSFSSQTDTEVVAQLIEREIRVAPSPLEALRRVVARLKGAFSLGVMMSDDPEALFLVKQGSPLVIGLGQGENFFASDAMALLPHTNKAIFLGDGEMARVSADGFELLDFEGRPARVRFTELDMSSSSIEKQGYRHFMLKEIHEQPRVVANAIKRIVDLDNVSFHEEALGFEKLDWKKIEQVKILGCGTAHYAGLLGKYFVEPVCDLPVEVELASEFRYRQPWLRPSTLVIAVSQSGETADTLACVKHAREKGCQILSLCNVEMSSIARESDSTIYLRTGPEIGVASTKAFTAMVLCQYLFGLALGKKRGAVGRGELEKRFAALRSLPTLMGQAVELADQTQELASRYYEASDFIFLGRGTSYAIALEGALKLKEISYIHAEGYAAGELKHGPIALVDRHMPVLAVAPKDFYYEKMVSNIEEVKAREGQVISVGAGDDERLKKVSDDFVACPQSDDPGLQTLLSVVPLQLFSYYVAVKRGTDVDQPRNLAKSVTVE